MKKYDFEAGDTVKLSCSAKEAGYGKNADPDGSRVGEVQGITKSGRVRVVWRGLMAEQLYDPGLLIKA